MRVVPTSKTTALQIASLFMDFWIIPNGIPEFVLTDNGTQFISKLFELICAVLGTRHLTTTAYYLQTNGQAKRFNKTIIARLQHCVAEHLRGWDIQVQALTYTYSSQLHRSKNITPFSLVLSRQCPGSRPTAFDHPTALPTDGTATTLLYSQRARLLHRVCTMWQDADKRMKSSP